MSALVLYLSEALMNRPSPKEVPLTRLIPNVITVFGICVGLTAVRYALSGQVAIALYLLVLAMILDAVDGKVARAMNSQSHIGAELDTLADFFNFGIATPLILYFTLFVDTSAANLGWLSVLTLAVCCAFRLARFNVGILNDDAPQAPSSDFVGVPAPALACLALSPLFLVMLGVEITGGYATLTAAFLVFVGLLAVGTFATPSLKGFTIPRKFQSIIFFGIAMSLTCLLVFPWQTLLIGNALYLISLPIYAMRARRNEG